MNSNFPLSRVLFPNDPRSYWEFNSTVLESTPESGALDGLVCYDDYYCSSNQLASSGHVALGVFGLLLTLAGLVLNILLIPVLRLAGIRSSATYYMSSMAVSDCCLLFIDLILVVVRYLPSVEPNDQLIMYRNFIVYLIPFGLPTKSACEIIGLAMCAGLIIDRVIYEKFRTKKRMIKPSHAGKVITLIVVLVLVSKVPSFFLLKIVENCNSFPTSISVKWTLLAKPWIFVFNSAVFLFVYITLVCSVVVLLFLSMRNHSIPRLSIKKTYEVSPDDRIFRRERLYLVIGLLIGSLTAILQIPGLIQSVLLALGPMNHDIGRRSNLISVAMWAEIMNMILIVFKPVLYLVFVVYLRQAFKDMVGLWVRPSRYSELYISGGMGKIVDLRSNPSAVKINRSDTTDTLLKCCNSDNRLNEPNCVSEDLKKCLVIEALAQEQILKSKFFFSSSDSYIGSTASFFSNNNSESQSSNVKFSQ